jgi:hypothetical protein
MHKLLSTAALFALVSGCTYDMPPPQEPDLGGQSYAEAIKVFCDVDRLARIPADHDPLALGRARTDFIQERVENPDGIYLRTMLSVKGAAEQAAMLREEAKEIGLDRCALADDLEKDGVGGVSP